MGVLNHLLFLLNVWLTFAREPQQNHSQKCTVSKLLFSEQSRKFRLETESINILSQNEMFCRYGTHKRCIKIIIS